MTFYKLIYLNKIILFCLILSTQNRNKRQSESLLKSFTEGKNVSELLWVEMCPLDTEALAPTAYEHKHLKIGSLPIS